MTSLVEALQPANPIARSSAVILQAQQKQIIKIIAPYVAVRNKPGRRVGLLIAYLQSGVYECLLDTELVDKERWLRLPIGWICSMDRDNAPTYETVRDRQEAELSWHHELDKRKRMASAVVAMLVKSYPLPQVKRLVRGIVKHTNNNYPHKPMLKVSKKSIEDIMISLSGETHLTKPQVFEYIKVAAAQQSDPSQSVIDIVAEVAQLVDSRPSHWVVEDLNIIETEEVVRRKNKFVMAAASGDVKAFKAFVEHGGVELTSLHTELKYTALHAAADFGKHTIVQFIVQTGFSLDVRDPKRGQTALHFAAYNGRERVIRVLLDEYADRHIKNFKKLQPYEIADRQGHFLCREMLKYIPPVVKDIRMKESTVSMIEIEWDPPYQNFSHSSPIIEYLIECIPVDPTVPRNYVSEKSTFTTSATSAAAVVDAMCIDRDDVVAKAHTRTKSTGQKVFIPRGDKVATAMTVRFVNLTAYSEYSFRIKCRSLSGWSTYSAPSVFMTRAFVPDKPDPVEIIKISTNGIAMTWHPPLRANGFPVDHYQIELIDSKTLQRQVESDQVQRVDLQQAADAAVAAVARIAEGGGGRIDDADDNRSSSSSKGVTISPNRRISAAAIRRQSAIEEQGGRSKLHRVLRHKYLDLRFKYLTGLEPFRKYHCRVRAQNELGYSPWSDWTAPVAPAVGVTIKEFKPEKLSATLTWFEPLLSCGRTVECYEVQLCVMRGPMTKSVELLTSAEYVRAEEKAREEALANQSVDTEEKIRRAEAAGDCDLDAFTTLKSANDESVAEIEVKEKDPSQHRRGEDLMNEYVTIRADVTANYLEITDLKAGGRYKCRVRAKVKEYDTFYDWDRAVESAVFSMAPTPPDPPLHVRPSMATESIAEKAVAIDDDAAAAAAVITATTATRMQQPIQDADSVSAFSQSIQPETIETECGESAMQSKKNFGSGELGTAMAVQNSLTSSVVAAQDIDMNKAAQQESSFRKNLRRNLQIGQKISSQLSADDGEADRRSKRNDASVESRTASVSIELTTNDESSVPAELPPSWEITHDSITITWTNGLSNGLPVDDYRIECAKVRTYRVKDVIRAREAFRSELFSISTDEEQDAASGADGIAAMEADAAYPELYEAVRAGFPLGSNEPIDINESDEVFWNNEPTPGHTPSSHNPILRSSSDSTKVAVRIGKELQERDEHHRQQLWEQQMRLLQHREQVTAAKRSHQKALQLQQRAADTMPWEDITHTCGYFLGPQKFCAHPLHPGTTYIFRVKQRNALGWSKFSRASRMITTFPSVPPGAPVILSIQRTYVLLRWPVTTLRGGDVSKPASATHQTHANATFSFDDAAAVPATAAASFPEDNDDDDDDTGVMPDNGLTQLEYEVQIAAVDAALRRPRGGRGQLSIETGVATHRADGEYEVDVMKLDQIPSSAWRDAEVRDLTAGETAQLMDSDRHHAVALLHTESGRSLVLAQSTSMDDIDGDFRMQLLHSPSPSTFDTSKSRGGSDLSEIHRINSMIKSPQRSQAAAASAAVGAASAHCNGGAINSGDLKDEGFVYKMLQRLPSGTTFVIRVRVRTVVGWSPWSAVSSPFRTLS